MHGTPTQPEVDKLLHVFGHVRRDGSLIPWGAIEEVLGYPRAPGRFWTVVNRWRFLMLHTYGILLVGNKARGQGLVVATAQHMLDYGIQQTQHIERTLHKTTVVIDQAPTEELTAAERRIKEHVLQTQVAMLGYLRTHRSQIEPPGRTTGADTPALRVVMPRS